MPGRFESVARREIKLVRWHVAADVELDTRVRQKRYVGRAGGIALAIDVGDDLTLNGSNLSRTQRQLPDREEIAERKAAPNRRLDVHDTVASVRVDPVEARTIVDKRSFVAVRDVPGLADSDAIWNLLLLTVDEDGQVHVDVYDG